MAKRIRSDEADKSETALSEVIYSDDDLIASLDAQLRKGTVEAEQHEAGKQTTTSASGGLTVPYVAEAKGLRESAVHDSTSRSLRMHDFKVTALIADLRMGISPDTDGLGNRTDEGTLKLFHGSAQLFDVQYLNVLFDKGESIGLLDAAKNHIYTAQEMPNAPWLVGKSEYDGARAALDFLPEAPSIILTLKSNKRQLLVPLKSSCLRYSLDVLYETFPGGYLGKWVVFGIFRPAPDESLTSGDSPLQKAIQAQRAVRNVLKTYGYPAETLTPIHIYRKLGTE